MGYLDETLTHDEQVVGKTHLHWIVFFAPFVVACFAAFFVGMAWLGGANDALSRIMRPGADWIARWEAASARHRAALTMLGAGVAVAVFGALYWFVVWIRYVTSEFAVTNRRVLLKVGFISRETVEIVLSKVETIKVRQGILGRMLGYGSIVVVGTGGSKDKYSRIAQPIEFRRDIQAQIARC